MKQVSLALTAETAELKALIQSALAWEDGIALSSSGAARRPDAAIFIGALPHFFQLQRGNILKLARDGCRVICVSRGAIPWLAGVPRCESVPLPDRRDARSLDLFRKTLLIRAKALNPRGDAARLPVFGTASRRLVGIGASTGGPQVLLSILRGLPPATCGILIVQHLSAGFSIRFSEYLDSLCAMRVKLAENSEIAENGTIYLAEDGRHLTVAKQPDGYRLHSVAGEKVNGFCPSADMLLASLAAEAGGNAMGVVLTGMGADGAEGLRRVREAGGCTAVQDEASCAVRSMPREAMRLGGAAEQLPPALISERILRFAGV